MSAGQVSAHGEEGPSRPAAASSGPRPLATIAVFALVGPLIVILVHLMIVVLLSKGGMLLRRNDLVELPGLLPSLMMIAYYLFGLPALVVGIGTVAADRWMQSSGWRYWAAATIGVASVVGFLLVQSYSRVQAIPQGLIQRLGELLDNLLFSAPIGVVAALVCAWLTRRWRYNVDLTQAPNRTTNWCRGREIRQ